jgi:branched-chain amino acid transport system ATP-binding protein
MSLVAKDLEVSYGRIPVLRGVSLSVQPGQIVAILGGNAAGKSTTLKTLIGLLKPSRGSVEVDGRRLDGLSSRHAVEAGLALVPENRRLFPRLTVLQNLQLGGWRLGRGRATKARLDEICARFPFVESVLYREAGLLSGGEQQQVAIARALMSRPKFLLLDEPSMGLSPALVEQSFALLKTLRDEGLGILVVEQNTEEALTVSDVGFVLQEGQVAITGRSADLWKDTRVRKAFLGLDTPTHQEEMTQ